MSALRFRPASAADEAWAFAVVRDGIADVVVPWFGWDDADQRRRFGARFDPALTRVVVVEGCDVGWVRTWRDGEALYVDQMFLEVRGQGIGTEVLERLIGEGGGRVRLGVLKNNRAHRLYHRRGFRVVGDQGYKWDLLLQPEGPPPEGVLRDPSDEEVRAVVARHGLTGPLEPLPRTGIANRVWAVGDAVVRIAVGSPVSWEDARTEAVAVPALDGVATPKLLAFEEACPLVQVPVTVYERVDGRPALDGAGLAVWADVGRALAPVHATSFVPDGCGWLDDPGASETGEDVFLHNDLHAGNVLVKNGRLAALIDWGDAGFGDRALDFVAMPPEGVPAAVAAYREASGVVDDTLERRILHGLAATARRRPQTLAPLRALLGSDPGPAWTRWFGKVPAIDGG